MALRQMSLARMGQYRPPVRSVSEGGKTGRMRLLHNGPGNGLMGGGGMNAKGTGGGIKVPQHMRKAQRSLRKARYAANKTNSLKMADRQRDQVKRNSDQTKGGTNMAPHPVGRFQYGHDQWGFINQRGLVNWNAGGPKGKQPVVGFNEALPYLRQKGAITKMPTRKTAPAYYQDAIYARQMAQRNADMEAAKAAWEYSKSLQEQDYDRSLYDLRQENQNSERQMFAGLSGANLAGSGVASAAIGDLASQFQDALHRTGLDNTSQMNKIQLDLQNAQTAYNTGKSGEIGVAKERWLALNPGKKAPQPQRGLWESKGQKMYTNKQGIPQTWGTKAKPKKKVR